jgi:putative endonuclease
MPHAYIVECCDGSYYVGSTWDLERRIGEHNLGLGAAYTRRRRPVRLVWSTEFSRIEEAYLLEKQIQGWGRAKRQALIDGRLEDLPALSRTAKPRATGVSTSSTHDQGSTNEPGSPGSNTHSGSPHDRGASGAGVRRSPGR